MVSCLQRLVGLFLIVIGVIVFVVLLADLIPFTELLALFPLVAGIKLAFPNVRLPKIGK